MIYGLDYHFCANVIVEKKIAEKEDNSMLQNKENKGAIEDESGNCTKFGTHSITKIITAAEGWYALIASMLEH